MSYLARSLQLSYDDAPTQPQIVLDGTNPLEVTYPTAGAGDTVIAFEVERTGVGVAGDAVALNWSLPNSAGTDTAALRFSAE